jgi:hypothetical protein
VKQRRRPLVGWRTIVSLGLLGLLAWATWHLCVTPPPIGAPRPSPRTPNSDRAPSAGGAPPLAGHAEPGAITPTRQLVAEGAPVRPAHLRGRLLTGENQLPVVDCAYRQVASLAFDDHEGRALAALARTDASGAWVLPATTGTTTTVEFLLRDHIMVRFALAHLPPGEEHVLSVPDLQRTQIEVRSASTPGWTWDVVVTPVLVDEARDGECGPRVVEWRTDHGPAAVNVVSFVRSKLGARESPSYEGWPGVAVVVRAAGARARFAPEFWAGVPPPRLVFVAEALLDHLSVRHVAEDGAVLASMGTVFELSPTPRSDTIVATHLMHDGVALLPWADRRALRLSYRAPDGEVFTAVCRGETHSAEAPLDFVRGRGVAPIRVPLPPDTEVVAVWLATAHGHIVAIDRSAHRFDDAPILYAVDGRTLSVSLPGGAWRRLWVASTDGSIQVVDAAANAAMHSTTTLPVGTPALVVDDALVTSLVDGEVLAVEVTVALVHPTTGQKHRVRYASRRIEAADRTAATWRLNLPPDCEAEVCVSKRWSTADGRRSESELRRYPLGHR